MHILKKLKHELKSAVEEAGYTEEQWKKLDEKTKKQYLEDHPNSKYAKKDKPSQKDNNSLEEIDETMTTEEAKEYWRDYHTTDPILEDYKSFEDWYRESKQNGYIKDNLEVEHQDEEPSDYYDAGHAEEWMERHPHGYYNSEDDYGIDSEEDSEDDYDDTMTTEEAKEYWKENHNSDPILEYYDSFEDWYKESKENGYIKDNKITSSLKGFWIFESDGTAVKFAKSKKEAEKWIEKMLEPIYGQRAKNKGLQEKEYKIEEHNENNHKHKILLEHIKEMAY